MVPPWAVMSPRRAAGRKPIITDVEPLAMTSGGPTQTAMSLTRAAGMKQIILPIGNEPDVESPEFLVIATASLAGLSS